MSQWTALRFTPADEARARRRPPCGSSRPSSRRRGCCACGAGCPGCSRSRARRRRRAPSSVSSAAIRNSSFPVADASTTTPSRNAQPDALAGARPGRAPGTPSTRSRPRRSPRAASRRTPRPACCSAPSSTWPSRPAIENVRSVPGADDPHRLGRVEPLGVAAHPRRPRRPSRAAARRRRSPCSRRASSRPPGRARSSGTGSRPSGISRAQPPLGPNGGVRLAAARPAGRARASSPPRVFSGAQIRIRASSSSRMRASLGAISPSELDRRLARPEAVERHLLRVDVAEPHERIGALARDQPDHLLEQRPRRAASRATITCQPGWTSRRPLDEQPRVLLDARVYSAHAPFSWTTLPSSSIRPPFRSSLTMSQWMRARVQAADLREAGADREVDRALHLLVEERVPHVPLDARVAADPELAEPPRALVGVERAEQELLVAGRGCLDDRARPRSGSRTPPTSWPR